MYNREQLSSDDLNDWWDDLTIEQRFAAYVAWCKSDVQSIHINQDILTDNTTHSNIISPAHLFLMNNKQEK